MVNRDIFHTRKQSACTVRRAVYFAGHNTSIDIQQLSRAIAASINPKGISAPSHKTHTHE
jgi:hypothetical protein